MFSEIFMQFSKKKKMLEKKENISMEISWNFSTFKNGYIYSGGYYYSCKDLSA